MNKIFVQCSTKVEKAGIRRETVDGVEHFVVSSYTLPDDVVMNGGLYPAEEIEKSYKSLERTLAPIEHPHDGKGNFLSASDPQAIHNFHAGAFNVNVTRADGRVHIEKYINISEAEKTERGKKLLERINELETNENPRPIHTSTGVYLVPEQLDGPMVNAAGDEYTWIAREMVFDHDAILLNSVGAATPEKGVGMMVNAAGEDECPVHQIEIAHSDPIKNDIGTTAITEQLITDIKDKIAAEWINIIDLFEESAIFETEQGFFTVPWRIDDETARIVGIPVRVDRVVTYTPKINQSETDMKEMIINALKEAGVDGIDEMSDTQLFDEFQNLNTNAEDSAIADAVSAAVAPLIEQVNELTAQVNAKNEAEHESLVSVIVNSGKYPGLDEDGAKMLPTDKLQAMAANCGHAHGVPLNANDKQDDSFVAPVAMPE